MNQEINNIHQLACILESSGFDKEAKIVHDLFIKKAAEFKPKYEVEFPMNLDDALNNYDSNTYEVDSEGDWEETDPVLEFRKKMGDEMLHSPAAVDDNHIIFENPKNKHIEVMNMVPKHHLDSLHKNDD